MNLPANHRLVTPEELANGPLPGMKYNIKDLELRAKFKSVWVTWDNSDTLNDWAKSTFDFCIPAVPAAEEKGEANPLMAFAEYMLGWCRDGGFLTAKELTQVEKRANEAIAAWNRRPTPAIQQAVEALECVIEIMNDITDAELAARHHGLAACEISVGDVIACRRALTALHHLNGEVRG